MFVQDLYAILHALWVDNVTPQHGFIRVQIALLLLFSTATAIRPDAIVESASAKGSNRALLFKDVELMKVRNLGDSKKSTIIANITLEHVKIRREMDDRRYHAMHALNRLADEYTTTGKSSHSALNRFPRSA